MQSENAIAVREHVPTMQKQPSLFDACGDLDRAIRIAEMLSASSLVPQQYQGPKGQGNILIALEMANRTGLSPLQVMQNLHIIQGRPSWSSSFMIALIERSGKFEPLEFIFSGDGDDWGCLVQTIERSSGIEVKGPKVDIRMAKDEGWYQKAGSKWKTMPEVMLRYRAAAFFARSCAPEIIYGYSEDEALDMPPIRIHQSEAPTPTRVDSKSLTDAILLEEEGEEALPSPEEKAALWKEYLEVCGQKNHAINAMKKITDGRGSSEWSFADIDNLRADLERRKSERQESPGNEEEVLFL